MRKVAQALADRFLHAAPVTLLLGGTVVALVDFAFLYAAAEHEGVLKIHNGIGLFQAYGLLSTVGGNAFLTYLARRYYDAVCSIRSSKAVTDSSSIDEPLAVLRSMVRLQGNYGFALLLIVVVGTLFWLSNFAIHVLGDPEAHWHHKVFDSKDHLLSFIASRTHNVFTYILIYPFVFYIVLFVSRQFRAFFRFSIKEGMLRFDLLNPDHRGGFSFAYKSHAIFNLIVATLYIQLAMHIGTYGQMNIEHYITLAIATLLLVFGNRIFLGDVFGRINTLRMEALDERKDRVYENDALSFEILKYCYQRRVNRYSLISVAAKLIAIGVSTGPKVYSIIERVVTSA